MVKPSSDRKKPGKGFKYLEFNFNVQPRSNHELIDK